MIDLTTLGADDAKGKYLAVPDIGTGESFTAALARDGKVYTWGRNSYGQLGDGGNENRMFPAEIEFDFGGGKTTHIVKISSDI